MGQCFGSKIASKAFCSGFDSCLARQTKGSSVVEHADDNREAGGSSPPPWTILSIGAVA